MNDPRSQEGKPAVDWLSSLAGMEGKISRFRRDGNTTRIVDNAIQILFSGKGCVARDHHMLGEHRSANEYLFGKILDRLCSEHGIKKEQIEIDSKLLLIRLKL